MMRATMLTLTAVSLGVAALAATAQAAGYSSTAREGYYYDQGAYVPARPADRLQRLGEMPAGEYRAFVPELAQRIPERPVRRALDPGDRLLDYHYDQGRYVKAFPE